MPRGTLYKPEYDEQAEKLCKLGFTDVELAEFFEVVEKTINNWKKDHPTFLQAIKRGKDLADAEVAAKLYERACGYSHDAQKIMQNNGEPVIVDYVEHYPPDTTACLAWLHNRQRGKWQRNPDPNGGAADAPPTKVIFEVADARTRETSQDGS